eukprot:1771972-Rhodomonas_salina.3
MLARSSILIALLCFHHIAVWSRVVFGRRDAVLPPAMGSAATENESCGRCFAEAASVGKMKLEVLDLANNRIRERGAATLALTIERYGAKLPLQSITLDGNAIGD